MRQDLTQELQRRADEKPLESNEIQEQFEVFERSWQGVQRKLNGVPEDCKSRPEEESIRQWSLESSRQQNSIVVVQRRMQGLMRKKRSQHEPYTVFTLAFSIPF